MNKIVITGGPSSGKSTLIEALKNKEYSVIEEGALELIEKEKKEGGNIFPWTDPEKFQEKVFLDQIKREENINEEKEIIFLDRSLIDILAYCLHYSVNPPKDLKKEIEKANYSKVFILDMLPKEYWTQTRNGRVRMHTYEMGVEIHEKIEETYEKSGLEIIYVPFISVEERVKFIEENIKK